jgi:predicted transcriptional regulator
MSNQRNLSDPIAIRIPADILTKIEQIAETSERTRSWVIVRALKAYLASEGGDVLAIEKGREEFAQGRLHDLSEVLDELEGGSSKDAAA